MATLTLRTLTNPGDTTKSTSLTSAEVDQNFIGLKTELEQKVFLDGGPQVVTSELEFSADTLEVGTNTGVTQYNFASGATTSGNTKTVNFGTGGLAGSTTAINFGTTVGSVSYTFNGTSAVKVPVGTTGARPSGASGMLRFNSTINKFEGHNGTTWSSVPHEQDVVLLTGNQTVAGIKTFSSSPVVPAGASGNQVPRSSEVVHMTGDETIAGVKTFSSRPKVPAGATGEEVPQAQEIFGKDQEYQTVTRDSGMVYTNSTGKPFLFTVIGVATAEPAILYIEIGGGYSYRDVGWIIGDAVVITAIIPDGATYKYVATNIDSITTFEYR